MAHRVNRRSFLQQAALGGTALAGAGYFTSRAAAAPKSPSEKLNIACIGVAKRGAANLGGVAHENIVALCDIDDHLLADAVGNFPKATRHNDFRKMLEQKNIEAVVVSTPDHTHAVATVAALKLGKHVYCEKPLTHNVYEARLVAQLAKEQKVATQMGTQIHAGDNYRRVVELVQSGAIGEVREVHVWVGTIWSGGDRPADTPEVPKHLHWDLWLGPAPERPYHPTYVPFHWRGWWDFGGGALNDMACHYMDLPFWALGLRHPTRVFTEGETVHPESAARGLRVTYDFPARDGLPPVKLIWRDGTQAPKEIEGVPLGGSGVLFIGSKGKLLSNYSKHKLFPESKFADFTPPPQSIPASVGHHREWIAACKTGAPTTCNFDYSGALTESVLLGTVSYRAGSPLDWDAANLKATNCPNADAYLKREYRTGWTL